MSSIIEGYNYDIFISYRQKDNKYDGWVTTFVDNLKKELEATFKEEISVYFDINPHDGLLETHDVDASLKDKLKCLVFIPIISRTYCDPKSFAWEHEFKAFVEQASQDRFGLKIRLPNGNVANRVLPVRIHDLDQEDIKLCESIQGGVMRGVEFIYKEPGVNRSLLPKDHEEKNLNNTNYRNQINKVALAIKEIILGLRTEPSVLMKEPPKRKEPDEEAGREGVQTEQEKPAKLRKSKLLSGAAIIAVLIVAAILAYPKIFKRNTIEKLRLSGERISVAVMPFQNMTNDTIWNVWQNGIQTLLINSLSNSEELKVRQTESINGLIQSKQITNYAKITPSVASALSQKLEANVFVYGSINQAGETIRLTVQLIDSKTEEVFKSFQIEGPSKEEMIFTIIDSLSGMVKNFLIISKLKKEVTRDFFYASTSSPEAFRYFTYGINAFMKDDSPSAIRLLSEAIAIDSNFFMANIMLTINYKIQKEYDKAKYWCLKAYGKRDQMSLWEKTMENWNYALLFETPKEEINYLKQLLELDDQFPGVYYMLGLAYYDLEQYDKAIPELEKAIMLYDKWGSKPIDYNYWSLGDSYHNTVQYEKEKTLYEKALQDYPNYRYLINNKLVPMALALGDTVAANDYIKKYNIPWSEARTLSTLAGIYSQKGMLDKAEEYYRKALSLQPQNPGQLNNLAWFLIDNTVNINEGLELVEKALKLSPDNFSYLDCNGWGLYKQGKYKEALELIERSWSLKSTLYDHRIFLHLEAAKKAVASQKRTDR
jgi:tetratricopeptide (TPR) repeat protein